jgi:thioredoxin 1
MPMTRRATLAFLTLIVAPLLSTAAALADTTPLPYTAAAFESAQKAGKPILIDTFATWCDVCKRQAPIIEKLRMEPKYKDLVILRVDFDTQKDVMRKFGARVQSTLIFFRGMKEVDRSVGETQGEWIDDMLQKTIDKSSS